MSHLTLRNHTAYIAQYVVLNGQQVIARLPGLMPNAQMAVPTGHTFQVVATTMIDGNTYTSAPLDVSGPAAFLAQVRQVYAQGTYEFEVVELPSTRPDQLQFQKTNLAPVSFTISKDGVPLQTVVVSNSFEVQTLAISDTFTIHAVINGITTDTVTTTNANAAITATIDTSNPEFDYFTLDVSCDASAVGRGEGDGMIHAVEAVGVPVGVSIQDGRAEATPAEGSV